MQINRKDDIIDLTPEWKGERFEDGRPRVPDEILERISKITITEAWKLMFVRGYKFQFTASLKRATTKPIMVGRALTGSFLPARPDMDQYLRNFGREVEGRKGNINQWVVDMMQPGDVVVLDNFGKVFQGCAVGGNLATVIKEKGGAGAVMWHGMRDLEQVETISECQYYYKESDPTPFRETMLRGINVPCMIDGAVCVPGDVVLGTSAGVIFIPPHLAELCAIDAEKSHVQDIFGFQRVAEGIYAAYQVDSPWTEAIWDDFMEWFATDEKAIPYRHLDFTEELEEVRAGIIRPPVGMSAPWGKTDGDTKW